MEPTSPKGYDLRRDGRYALHCSVSNSSGESGEFFVSGHAKMIDEPAIRELAVALATYTPADRYILYELDVESASSTTYTDGETVRHRWKAGRE